MEGRGAGGGGEGAGDGAGPGGEGVGERLLCFVVCWLLVVGQWGRRTRWIDDRKEGIDNPMPLTCRGAGRCGCRWTHLRRERSGVDRGLLLLSSSCSCSWRGAVDGACTCM